MKGRETASTWPMGTVPCYRDPRHVQGVQSNLVPLCECWRVVTIHQLIIFHSTIPTHPQTSTRIATSTQIRSSSVTSALTTSQAAPEAPVSSSSIVSSATISSLPPPTATQTIFSSPKPLSVGAIAGIVISIVTALAAILFLCICAQRARKRRRASTIAPEPYPTPGMPAQSLTLMPFSALVPGQPTARPPEARKGFREALVRIGITGPATMAQLERAVQQNAALRERIRVLEGETQRHTPSQSGPDSSSPPAYYIGTPTLR
ncbi:hypothetical protein C8R45DRAFT_295796 [Mycena sanguinolenta]|nr:hypothetical protein C8R45DRAFT_295796 [Mycena sanguinolenta]